VKRPEPKVARTLYSRATNYLGFKGHGFKGQGRREKNFPKYV